MEASGFALFDAALGRCGLAWSDDGVVAVQLPERSVSATRARLQRIGNGLGESEPPAAARRAMEAVRDYLAGARPDLRDVALDMSDVPEPDRRIYETVREVGAGSRTTYGELARRVGPPATARSVGAAMARNRFAPVVPCHRVVAADGRLGGYSAQGGLGTKLRLLAIEMQQAADPGARATSAPPFDLERAVVHLRGHDDVMARVIDEHGACTLRIGAAPTVFAALARAIVFQQLHTRAAEAIHARLLALLDAADRDPEPLAVLAAPEKELRAAGLSLAKIASLRDLAELSGRGAIPTLAEARSLDDEAVVERVTRVRGVGRWTAQMLLLFTVGKPDVLPVDDFGVRSGFTAAYDRASLPAPRELDDFGRRWAPYRTVASWYLWRVAESAAKTTHPT